MCFIKLELIFNYVITHRLHKLPLQDQLYEYYYVQIVYKTYSFQ